MLGGLEWYIYNISRHLIARGHEVHVFVAKSHGESLPDEEVIEGINVHRLPLYLDVAYRVKIMKGLVLLLATGGFDIIHTYDYAAYHSAASIFVKRICKIPVVLTVMDVHSLIPRRLWKRLALSFFEKGFARFVLNSVDKILVRANELRPELRKIGVDGNKILITPSGIDGRALKLTSGSPFRSRYGISGKLILFTGRIHPIKGLGTLVLAMPMVLARFHDAKLVIAGPDQVGYKKTLVKLAEELGVKDSLLFLEPIEDFDKKMQAYAACDLFVLPSLFEGTSQAIFDAMSQGKPIVASRRGGIPSQIADGMEGLLIDPNDPNTLADSIIKLLSDRKLAKRLGENARKKACLFTYDILIKQIEGIYENLTTS